MDTEILLDHEPVADGGYLVRAMLRIRGQAPEAEDRPPLNLALVLDRSGSMSGQKIRQAKEAAKLLVRRLGDEDSVAIVTYDNDVQTLAGRTPGARREELMSRIDSILLGGSTNLSGGWLRGRELVAEDVVEGGVNRVLLLTDGLANVGIQRPGQLRDLTASAAAKGISTTTIGFGASYNERLLRAMAEAGSGNTHHIEAPDQAPAVFEAEIEGLMALAAQNVAVTVKPAAGVTDTAVLHQYPRHRTDDGALRLELGDLYALEPKSLLTQFLLRGDDGAEVDVATLTLEAHVLLPGGGVDKQTIAMPIRVSPGGGAVTNPEVRHEALVLEAARAREEALDDRDRGDFDGAAAKLREVASRLAPHSETDAELRDELDDLEDMAERLEGQKLSEADAKYMYQRAYGTARSKKEMMKRMMEDRAAERAERKGDQD